MPIGMTSGQKPITGLQTSGVSQLHCAGAGVRSGAIAPGTQSGRLNLRHHPTSANPDQYMPGDQYSIPSSLDPSQIADLQARRLVQAGLLPA